MLYTSGAPGRKTDCDLESTLCDSPPLRLSQHAWPRYGWCLRASWWGFSSCHEACSSDPQGGRRQSQLWEKADEGSGGVQQLECFQHYWHQATEKSQRQKCVVILFLMKSESECPNIKWNGQIWRINCFENLWVVFGLFQSLRDLSSGSIENFLTSIINLELCIRVT